MKKFIIILFLLFIQKAIFAQNERIINADFSYGINGGVPYGKSTAWNTYNFDITEWKQSETDAINQHALVCKRNKPFDGKDNYGIGQYSGRAQAIIPCPEAGTTYVFSARAKVQMDLGSEEPGEIALLFYNAQGLITSSPILYFSNTNYQTQTQNITVPTNAVWCNLWIRKKENIDFTTDWVSLKATTDDTPNSVTNFTATAIASTKVALHWDTVTGASGYKIERKLSTENATKWKTIFITMENGMSTSFLDARDAWLKQLEPNITYNYRITALGDYGNSNATQLTVTTNAMTQAPENTRYYIDATNGDDLANGTSENTAWKTFMNIDRLLLSQGDSILLKCGEIWQEPLHIHGSGTLDNTIVVATYGAANEKPIIAVNGKAHAAIRMLDVSYCKVQDIELSNYHPYFREFGKFALEAGTWQTNNVSHLEFDNLYIHNVLLLIHAHDYNHE